MGSVIGIAVAAPRVARVESFGAHVAPQKFRLLASHIADLREVFSDVETRAGLKSCNFDNQNAQRAANADPFREKPREDVYRYDLEKYCDTINVWAKNGIGARTRRSREALKMMADEHVTILFRMYGPVPKQRDKPLDDCTKTWRELMPIIEDTDAIEARRRELVAERAAKRIEEALRKAESCDSVARFAEEADRSLDAELLAQIAKAEARRADTKRDTLSRRLAVKQEALRQARRAGGPSRVAAYVRDDVAARIRGAVNREVTTAEVLKAALMPPALVKGTTEGQAAFKERCRLAKVDRQDFVREVTRQAERLLERASVEYRAAWGKLGPRGR